MSDRRKATEVTAAAVLLKSKRRCALCFGLQHDEAEKPGQLAHLDWDPANSTERNLVWLCLDHHNNYDSRTSQSKNYTKHEVQAYREQLYDRMASAPSVGPPPILDPSPTYSLGPSVFLARSAPDKSVAREFHALLQLDGFRPWDEDIDMHAGQSSESTTESAIRDSGAIALFLSKRSVGKNHRLNSDLERTLDIAEAARVRIVPVCLESVRLPRRLQRLGLRAVEADSRNWIGSSYVALQKALDYPVRLEQRRGGDSAALALSSPSTKLRRRRGLEVSSPSLSPPSSAFTILGGSNGVRKGANMAGVFTLLASAPDVCRQVDVIWNGGAYLVRGCNPDGDFYAGVARLIVEGSGARMQAIIEDRVLNYAGQFDGNYVSLSGAHDVRYKVPAANGVLRGEWNADGVEELIPPSRFSPVWTTASFTI